MSPDIPSKYTRPGPMAIRLLIDALMSGPHTYDELTDVCGLHRTTLSRWLTAWRRPAGGLPRCVRIAEWGEDRQGRRNTPSFEWGAKPDAKRAPVPGAVRQARRRAAYRAQQVAQALRAAP